MTTQPPRLGARPHSPHFARHAPRLLRTAPVLLAAVLLVTPLAAQDSAGGNDEKAPVGVNGRLATIDAKLDRIAAALEAQQEMAQIELMLRRVEAAERRIDGLETARIQARTYLGTLDDKRVAAEERLAEARRTVRSGWPTGPREEVLRREAEAEAELERITEEIEEIEVALAQIDGRVRGLQNDAAEWSALLESRLAEAGLRRPSATATPAAAGSGEE